MVGTPGFPRGCSALCRAPLAAAGAHSPESGRSPPRGCTRRGRRSRRRPGEMPRSTSRTSPGKGGQSRSEPALGGHSQGPAGRRWAVLFPGENPQGKDASRPGGAPVWVRARWARPVHGAQSAVRPPRPPPVPRPQDCPLCRAARDLCIADLTSFAGAVSSYNPVILAESGPSLTHLRGKKQSQAKLPAAASWVLAKSYGARHLFSALSGNSPTDS